MRDWDSRERCALTEAYHSRREDPRHPALLEDARKLGFRPATLSEILDNSDFDKKYTWCGEVFCKLENDEHA